MVGAVADGSRGHRRTGRQHHAHGTGLPRTPVDRRRGSFVAATLIHGRIRGLRHGAPGRVHGFRSGRSKN